ncbi:MAG: sugar kinase, partial [Shimia sp.]
MARAPQAIACIGEAMIELTALDLATGQAAVGVAGDVYNTAVYLRRALEGGTVAFVSALGADPLSEAVRGVIGAAGLRTDLIARHPTAHVGLYGIERDAEGERTFTYWRDRSAARGTFGPCGPALAALDPFDTLYLSGITLAILPPDIRADLTAYCARRRAEGATVAFDGNYRPRLWGSEDEARAALDAMWRAASIALPSRDDEAMLHPGQDEAALAARIAALGAEEVVLKCGAHGPFLRCGTHETRTDFPPARRVVDTTAA